MKRYILRLMNQREEEFVCVRFWTQESEEEKQKGRL